jgi:hypothetical protein
MGRRPAVVAAVEQPPSAERRDRGGHLMWEGCAGDVEPQPSQLAGHCALRIVIAEKHGTEQLHPLGEQRQSATAVGEYPLSVGITDQRAGEDKIATARVESNMNSSIGRGRPRAVVSAHGGDVGCTKTTARRR